MKTKDRKDIQTKDQKELIKSLTTAKRELFSALLENTQGKLKNTRLIFHKRKEIARILTSIRAKEVTNG